MKFWKWFFILLGPALLALFIAVMLMVAYPNALKLAAPTLCADDKPDAFVVRYDVQTSDGTGTNFTLFCMSERGEIEEIGTWEPLLFLFLLVAAMLYASIILMWSVRLVRRALRGGDPDPPLGLGAPEPVVMTADQILGPQAQDPFDTLRDQHNPG